MTGAFVQPLAAGLLTGVFGALLPGPLSAWLVGKKKKAVEECECSSSAAKKLALSIAIGLMLGPWVGARVSVVAVGCVALGATLGAAEIVRRCWIPAAIPMLALQWTLLVGFAVSLGLVPSTLAATLTFAAGLWLGAGGLLALLGIVGRNLRSHEAEPAMRILTVLVAAGLVGLGLYAATHAISA